MYNLNMSVLSYTEKDSILACYCTTEPEAWFLGRVIETCWTTSAATRGDRGIKLKKNTKYITVMKIQEVIGGTHFFEELEGVEGQVIVPAEFVICTDVELIFKCQNPSLNLIRKDLSTTVPVVILSAKHNTQVYGKREIEE